MEVYTLTLTPVHMYSCKLMNQIAQTAFCIPLRWFLIIFVNRSLLKKTAYAG